MLAPLCPCVTDEHFLAEPFCGVANESPGLLVKVGMSAPRQSFCADKHGGEIVGGVGDAGTIKRALKDDLEHGDVPVQVTLAQVLKGFLVLGEDDDLHAEITELFQDRSIEVSTVVL